VVSLTLYRSIVVEDALCAFREEQAPAPVYFYCSRNPAEPGRSDPARIVASIARQLAKPPDAGILAPAIRLYKEHEASGFATQEFTLSEGEKFVLQLLEHYKGATVILVLDALDECNPDTREDLLATLEHLLEESPCLLKIFVSSRDDQDIKWILKNYRTLELSSDRNSADIRAFIDSELTRRIDRGKLLRSSARKEELRQKMVRVLTSDAGGMYVSLSSIVRVSLTYLGSGGSAFRSTNCVDSIPMTPSNSGSAGFPSH
jgi:hypothetical protein